MGGLAALGGGLGPMKGLAQVVDKPLAEIQPLPKEEKKEEAKVPEPVPVAKPEEPKVEEKPIEVPKVEEIKVEEPPKP